LFSDVDVDSLVERLNEVIAQYAAEILATQNDSIYLHEFHSVANSFANVQKELEKTKLFFQVGLLWKNDNV
jgi:hypothetical protein